MTSPSCPNLARGRIVIHDGAVVASGPFGLIEADETPHHRGAGAPTHSMVPDFG